MDKITQALKKILPPEHVAEVAKAVEETMAAQLNAVNEASQAKLDEAYEEFEREKTEERQVFETGYRQAYEIVASVMNRLDEQRQVFEKTLKDGFNEAFEEIEKVKAENKDVEMRIYEECNAKLQQMKNIFIEKLDRFMDLQEKEVYEAAMANILKDPRILEQRVAIEKIAAILSDHVRTDDLSSVISNKLEEAHKEIETLRGHLRVVESKNVNLSIKNKNLSEAVEHAKTQITEATKVERTERANKRTNASGRGQRVVNEQIINEFAAPAANKSGNEDQNLTEGNDPLLDLLVLSGLEERSL